MHLKCLKTKASGIHRGHMCLAVFKSYNMKLNEAIAHNGNDEHLVIKLYDNDNLFLFFIYL